MALLGYTIPETKEKVRDGSKRQTIRKLRKRPIKVGERLYHYWHLRQKDCEKLRESICKKTFFISLLIDRDGFWEIRQFNSHPSQASQSYRLNGDEIWELAKKDCFESSTGMVETLRRMHKIVADSRTFFQVISW